MINKIRPPHPALREYVNHIAIFQNVLNIEGTNDQHLMSCPPLPENSLFFYPFERLALFISPSVVLLRMSHLYYFSFDI